MGGCLGKTKQGKRAQNSEDSSVSEKKSSRCCRRKAARPPNVPASVASEPPSQPPAAPSPTPAPAPADKGVLDKGVVEKGAKDEAVIMESPAPSVPSPPEPSAKSSGSGVKSPTLLSVSDTMLTDAVPSVAGPFERRDPAAGLAPVPGLLPAYVYPKLGPKVDEYGNSSPLPPLTSDKQMYGVELPREQEPIRLRSESDMTSVDEGSKRDPGSLSSRSRSRRRRSSSKSRSSRSGSHRSSSHGSPSFGQRPPSRSGKRTPSRDSLSSSRPSSGKRPSRRSGNGSPSKGSSRHSSRSGTDESALASSELQSGPDTPSQKKMKEGTAKGSRSRRFSTPTSNKATKNKKGFFRRMFGKDPKNVPVSKAAASKA